MPHLYQIVGTGTAQRRLVSASVKRLSYEGYDSISRREGGDWRSLMTENQGLGIFGDKSVIIVEEAEKLGPLPENLAPLLEPEGAPVVVVLVCKSEVPAIIPKSLAGRCSRSKAEEPSPWSRERDDIVRLASRESGVTMSRDGLVLLKELFDDAGELAGEAEKLAVFCKANGRGEISKEDVEALCLSDGNKSMLKLLDGICCGRTAECLASLEALSRNAELLPVLSALHNRMRVSLYAAEFPKEKVMFAKAFGVRDYALRHAEKAASLYGSKKLLRFVMGLININANEKSGMGASWRDLNILVVDLMSGG